MNINLKNKNIAIVTHRSLLPCIPGDDLKKFVLSKHCKSLAYIKHPLLYLKESYNLSSQYEYHKDSNEVQIVQAYHWTLPESVLYVKDFIYSIYWLLRVKHVYDLYFGINNLNALAGLLLKKLGRVKKVIYYTIDLFPQRFENRIINWFYHKVDRLCVKYCDETWNVSPFLVNYREHNGISCFSSKQFTVPIGIWFNEMRRSPINKIRKGKIVFVGHLVPFMGVDLAISALPLIRRKINNAKLGIIGGGDQLDDLKHLAKKLGVQSCVKFYGWNEKKRAERILSKCSIGLAPFNTTIIDEKIKNADPAKIKDYLALGLPIVMTNASVNATAIAKARCCIICEYTPESLASAVVKLLSNQRMWLEYRKNSLTYAQQYDWNNIFTKNISRLL